jgi:hypothetical protein
MRNLSMKFETLVCTALAALTTTTIGMFLHAVANMSVVA